MARKKNQKLQRGDIVHVEWGDAWEAPGWQPKADEDYLRKECKPLFCNSVGAFLGKNEKGILLTMGFDHNGKSMGEHFIPTGMVVQIKKLLDKKGIKTKK